MLGADAWRGFGQQTLPAGWQMIDGALTRVAPGGDIITREEFEDFELTLDWKIQPGGNSGIFYRVLEAGYNSIVPTGPEMQILDNQAHKDGLDPRTSAGSDYALYAPLRDVTRPPGEWNQVRMIVEGAHVEYWLNGTKVVEYELGSEDWLRRVQQSKFREFAMFGRAPRGHIALQDHGDWVAFRNIRIRRL